MERATGCAKGSLNDTTVQLCSILGGDTGAISALRILHLYMERLGCDFQVTAHCVPCLLALRSARTLYIAIVHQSQTGSPVQRPSRAQQFPRGSQP